MTDRTRQATAGRVLGYGVAGRVFHAPLIAATPGLRLAASSPPTRSAGATGRRTARRRGRRRRRGAVGRPGRLDLVVVATPNASHVSHARAAVAAGLPVVVGQAARRHRRRRPRAGRRGRTTGRPPDGVPEPPVGRRLRTVRRLVEDGAMGRVTRFECRSHAGARRSGPAGGEQQPGRRRWRPLRPRRPPRRPGRELSGRRHRLCRGGRAATGRPGRRRRVHGAHPRRRGPLPPVDERGRPPARPPTAGPR